MSCMWANSVDTLANICSVLASKLLLVDLLAQTTLHGGHDTTEGSIDVLDIVHKSDFYSA